MPNTLPDTPEPGGGADTAAVSAPLPRPLSFRWLTLPTSDLFHSFGRLSKRDLVRAAAAAGENTTSDAYATLNEPASEGTQTEAVLPPPSVNTTALEQPELHQTRPVAPLNHVESELDADYVALDESSSAPTPQSSRFSWPFGGSFEMLRSTSALESQENEVKAPSLLARLFSMKELKRKVLCMRYTHPTALM
jgi:hypothetical protein